MTKKPNIDVHVQPKIWKNAILRPLICEEQRFMLTMCASVFCNFSFGKSLGCIAITVSAYTIVCNQEQSLKSYFLASGGALHELK